MKNDHSAPLTTAPPDEITVETVAMRIFELKDVIALLRSKVKRAGGQAAWSKKTGINRTELCMVLTGRRLPSKKIIRVLELRTVFVSDPKLR